MVGALVAALVMSVIGGVVYAHINAGPTSMALKDNDFHYLGQTLDVGDSVSLSAATYIITINNEDKKTHIVEFEKGATEFKTPKIQGGKTLNNFSVTLDPGTWKVYCPLHLKQGMSFTLNVP